MAGTIGVASAKMIELGSDAEESANAFSVTFKEATDSLSDLLETSQQKLVSHKQNFNSSYLSLVELLMVWVQVLKLLQFVNRSCLSGDIGLET